jgi:hypothetical protein
MPRISTYRIILFAILCAGIGLESAITTGRAHLLLTRVLNQFPTRIAGFQGSDDQAPAAQSVRSVYWPAAVVIRTYTTGADEPIRVFISPDVAGAHPQSRCAPYAGWKILQETTGALQAAPLVKLTRTLEVAPPIPGYSATLFACDQYWRIDKQGLSQQDTRSPFFRRSFCFRVLLCTEIPNEPAVDGAFAKLDAFAASADPVVCQFLHRAEGE